MLVGDLCVLKGPEDHPDFRVQNIFQGKQTYELLMTISLVSKWFLSKECKHTAVRSVSNEEVSRIHIII